jgi:hypothetical protein
VEPAWTTARPSEPPLRVGRRLYDEQRYGRIYRTEENLAIAVGLRNRQALYRVRAQLAVMTTTHTEFSVFGFSAFFGHYMGYIGLATRRVIVIMYSLTHEAVVRLLIRKANEVLEGGFLQVWVILDWHQAYCCSKPAVEALVASRVHVRIKRDAPSDSAHHKIQTHRYSLSI